MGGVRRVGREFLGMGGSVRQIVPQSRGGGEDLQERGRNGAGEGTRTGWGNAVVAESHVRACASFGHAVPVSGTGKFPADPTLLKIAGWGRARGFGGPWWGYPADPPRSSTGQKGGGVGGGRAGGSGWGGYPLSKLLLCPAQVCLLRCTLLSSLALLLVCSIHETEQNSYCQQIITEKHLAELEELVRSLPGLCHGTGARLGSGARSGSGSSKSTLI